MGVVINLPSRQFVSVDAVGEARVIHLSGLVAVHSDHVAQAARKALDDGASNADVAKALIDVMNGGAA